MARGLVITGPTATGKSELAVEVAEHLDGEIICADSRQVYRELDLGTAKPAPELRRRVPHHGLDLVDPDERYSAGGFARDAWRWIDDIRSRRGVPLVVGGTGFFIRALLDPLAPEPDFDPDRRERLRAHLSEHPPGRLKDWLRRLDPRRASDLEQEGGSQRLVRSLEVALTSGRPHSWWLEQPAETPSLDAQVVCLRLPRSALYRRIEARFDQMMQAGLLDEVRDLVDRYGERAPGLMAVGYAELIQHVKGEMSLQRAVEAAKQSTRRYARRQLTWFRHQLPEDTLWLDATRSCQRLVGEVVNQWHAGSRSGSGSS